MAKRSRQATNRRSKRSHTPGWIWFVTGVCVGLGGAGLAYVQLQGGGAGVLAPREEPGASERSREVAESGNRPRFEFYTILPEKEVTVPEHEITPPSEDRPAPPSGASYMLQVGSFRKLSEADRLRAGLALIGLEADIQTVTVNDGETWHRVRLGPFRDLDALNAARTRLREHDMEAMVLKNKT
ncbi:MAG: SPOR domain-containing protein [Gammaproteobacteria bacterium]|nr:SPOR domain-containing protein [Gammaproteobacteria bacterium]NIR82234.1 SPOR domain-containing protein [Gammaproteobacteria bacterium]NIR90833.1 SPOR domain-containing protein [Gammaproteobacteria bacterium]NIU03384.1 SPOR domain-containing protein [Gammaproteobacteria bacterium]NIV50880.1 SPOR domain-containing protein [Gammaproteobacteria bacterium]